MANRALQSVEKANDPLACGGACEGGDPAIHHFVARSGKAYDVRLPTLAQWVEYGIIPNPLADIAAKIAYGKGFDPGEATPEERQQFHELMDVVVSKMVEPALDQEFVRGFHMQGTLSDPKWEQVTPAMPREDREQLWHVALRVEPVSPAEKGALQALESFRDVLERTTPSADKPSPKR